MCHTKEWQQHLGRGHQGQSGSARTLLNTRICVSPSLTSWLCVVSDSFSVGIMTCQVVILASASKPKPSTLLHTQTHTQELSIMLPCRELRGGFDYLASPWQTGLISAVKHSVVLEKVVFTTWLDIQSNHTCCGLRKKMLFSPEPDTFPAITIHQHVSKPDKVQVSENKHKEVWPGGN